MALNSVPAAAAARDAGLASKRILNDVLSAVKELQRLKIAVVNGAAADTNIAVAGIATVDTLVAVLQFDISGGNVVGLENRTSEASITSAGNIQLADTATTGDRLLVIYFDKA